MIPIFIAIDMPSYSDAKALVTELGDLVHLKIGLEFFIANGLAACSELRNIGDYQRQLFLDLKIHDIPNTVAGAIRSAITIKPDFITVHTCDGVEPLMAAAKANQMIDGHRAKLLGVTILTSVKEHDQEIFLDRLYYAAQAALDGIVCSASKLIIAKNIQPDLFRMTPGIRMTGSNNHDQISVATPRQAMDDGANAIVIGREITRAADPKAKVLEIMESMGD